MESWGDVLAGWGITIAHYREPLIFILIAVATLSYSIVVARRAAVWIDALERGSFSAERLGNSARKIATVERQLATAKSFRDAKWKEAGAQVTFLLVAGIIVPTFCLVLFSQNYNWFFAGPAYSKRLSDCMCAAPDAFDQLTLAQLGSLFITSLVPDDVARVWLPAKIFDVSYNFQLAPMSIAFWIHKLWAFAYVLQLAQDFSLKLLRLSVSVPDRIKELEKKLSDLQAEKARGTTNPPNLPAANDTGAAIAA